MSQILVIQNEVDEGLGLFAEELRQAEVSWDVVHPYKKEDTIPNATMLDELNYRGVIILGGPMSALDDRHFPFLRHEVRLIEDTLERRLPMLNVCLGAQLLARACGMPLKLGGAKEIGWKPVYLNEWYAGRNPLFFQLPDTFTTFHWHQDTFEVPIDAYRLAYSDLYPNQAFCLNGNAYGLQFHPEMTEAMIRSWIEKDQKRSGPMLSETEADQILVDMSEQLPQQKKIAHKIIYGFVSLLRPVNYRRPLVEPEANEEKPTPVTENV